MREKGWLKRKMEAHQSLDTVVRTIVTIFLPFLLLADKFEHGSGGWKFLGFIFVCLSLWVSFGDHSLFILIPVWIIDFMWMIIGIELLFRKFKRWRKKRNSNKKE